MLRYAIPLAAVAAIAVPASAAEIQIASQGPVVELSVNEVVRSAPDVAQVGAGVTTRAATAREALTQNSQAMDRIVARLRQLGIAGEDIQTSNFNLSPQYDYNQQSGEQVFRGYNVSNQVQVKLRDLPRAGEILDALVNAGANTIYGPNFMIEDDEAAKAEARAQAFARGRRMAEDYARVAGYSSVRLLEISESVQNHGPMPQPMMARAAMDSGESAPPIEPGQVGTGVSITVKYEMGR
ncbi:SIMPL domain-containing protein [Qipengyuania sp. DY56-A-20]|jgi:uncharacterized protein|uniref:SIMPL domain-containing protein n=1 Tax=Qipengyuania benthica TaxID=3067651 RepID=A0ABT9H6W0_9SPHN|nr:SIMPL domain-containing protein [Qipengyuania sp. DY56-A-20]MBU1253461.1 SIMPL domain-containing protein [Alphaproteobacteria bacterium]MBU1605706.1 SIMPL domain-containing protein [Alphaproteobacteria bacterium]MDP4539058.1 SIMPL domain-containing protein [Qipengyuania sp. DY56-A-20]